MIVGAIFLLTGILIMIFGLGIFVLCEAILRKKQYKIISIISNIFGVIIIIGFVDIIVGALIVLVSMVLFLFNVLR